jgi:hypothetical protein
MLLFGFVIIVETVHEFNVANCVPVNVVYNVYSIVAENIVDVFVNYDS